MNLEESAFSDNINFEESALYDNLNFEETAVLIDINLEEIVFCGKYSRMCIRLKLKKSASTANFLTKYVIETKTAVLLVTIALRSRKTFQIFSNRSFMVTID